MSGPADLFRALETMPTLPPGCGLQLVADGYSDPHLKLGEFAVVDRTDTAPQHGELYLIQWESGWRAIVQARSTKINWCEGGVGVGWYVGDLQPERLAVDGPYRTDHLKSKLVGRIVGVFSP